MEEIEKEVEALAKNFEFMERTGKIVFTNNTNPLSLAETMIKNWGYARHPLQSGEKLPLDEKSLINLAEELETEIGCKEYPAASLLHFIRVICERFGHSGQSGENLLPLDSSEQGRLEAEGILCTEISSKYWKEFCAKFGSGQATYPCSKCGKQRTKAEGGTVFTVCDDCWDDKSGQAEESETYGKGFVDGRNQERDWWLNEMKSLESGQVGVGWQEAFAKEFRKHYEGLLPKEAIESSIQWNLEFISTYISQASLKPGTTDWNKGGELAVAYVNGFEDGQGAIPTAEEIRAVMPANTLGGIQISEDIHEWLKKRAGV